MFERYTEQARRALFYGRFAASEMGALFIEAHHLLLGILHADPALAALFFADPDPVETLRQEFGPYAGRSGVSTTVQLPLSHETKRALTYGIEEADRMGSHSITTAHLLLGVMRTQDGPVVDALARRGLSADVCRKRLAERFVSVRVDPSDAVRDQADIRQALLDALTGRHAHAPPERVFAGLGFELAGNSPGAAHTIFEILQHLSYWQELCSAYVRGERPGWPNSAAESWPGPAAPADTPEWLRAVERFSLSLDELTRLARQCDLSAATGERTNLQAIQATARHNSYHLGQVVLLRQLLGAWPPPGGGMTG